MAKTAHDFQMSFVAFQRAQQASAEKQRTVVEGVKLAVHEDESQYVSPCFFYLIIRPSPGGPQPSRNVSFEAQHLMLRAEEAIHHCAAVEYYVYIVDDICGFLGKRLAY